MKLSRNWPDRESNSVFTVKNYSTSKTVADLSANCSYTVYTTQNKHFRKEISIMKFTHANTKYLWTDNVMMLARAIRTTCTISAFLCGTSLDHEPDTLVCHSPLSQRSVTGIASLVHCEDDQKTFVTQINEACISFEFFYSIDSLSAKVTSHC